MYDGAEVEVDTMIADTKDKVFEAKTPLPTSARSTAVMVSDLSAANDVGRADNDGIQHRALLASPHYAHRTTQDQRVRLMQQLQGDHGNQYVARIVGRRQGNDAAFSAIQSGMEATSDGVMGVDLPIRHISPHQNEVQRPKETLQDKTDQVGTLKSALIQTKLKTPPALVGHTPHRLESIPGIQVLHQIAANALVRLPAVGDANQAIQANHATALGSVAQMSAQLSITAAEAARLALTKVQFTLPNVDEYASATGLTEQSTAEAADQAAQHAERRSRSEAVASAFLPAVARRVQQMTKLGQAIQARLQPTAAMTNVAISRFANQQKQIVATRSAQLRAQMQREHGATRAQILKQHDQAVTAMRAATTAGRTQVTTAYTLTVSSINRQEQEQIERIQALYTNAQVNFRQSGEIVGNEATAIGAAAATEYRSHRINRDDNIWDGPLTDNRAEARADTATKVAQGYHDSMIDSANKQADELMHSPATSPAKDQAQESAPCPECNAPATNQGVTPNIPPSDRDKQTVHEIANQSREAMLTRQTAILANLDTAESQAISQADQSRAALSQSLEQAYRSSLRVQTQKVADLRRTLHETAQAEAKALNHGAQQAITGSMHGADQAARNVLSGAQSMPEMLRGIAAPNPDVLNGVLGGVLDQVDTSVAAAQAQIERSILATRQNLDQGVQQAHTNLADTRQMGLDSLTELKAGLSKTYTELGQSAHSTFSRLQGGHQQTVRKSADAAISSFRQANLDVANAFAQATQSFQNSLTQNRSALEQSLRCSLHCGIHKKIAEEADKAADEVQPRWKTALKWIVTIVVVLVVAIGMLFIPVLGPVLAIIVGAVIGALSGLIIQMISNGIDGKNAFDGWQEALIGGAIGGAVGGLGSVLLKAAGKFVFKAVSNAVLKAAGTTGLHLAGDFVFNTVGDILGKLALHQPFNLIDSLKAAGIGMGLAVGVGGAIGAGRAVRSGRTRPEMEAPSTRRAEGDILATARPETEAPTPLRPQAEPRVLEVALRPRSGEAGDQGNRTPVARAMAWGATTRPAAADRTSRPEADKALHLEESADRPGDLHTNRESNKAASPIKVGNTDHNTVPRSSPKDLDLEPNQSVAKGVDEGRSNPPTIQRKTKRTEKRILNEAHKDGFTEKHSQELIDKMGKDQKFSNARKIAAEVETESENLVQRLPEDQQEQVRKAIADYAISSKTIQENARDPLNELSKNVTNLDAALQALRGKITADANERIVYRSVAYNSGADIPYGQQARGQQIKVGDYVGDTAFLSTSEHRQFVLGKEQTGQVNALLKLVIYGQSGVPIALHTKGSYTNPNLKKLYDMQGRAARVWNTVFGPGPRAGQAEVLFPRNSVFQVKKIVRNGKMTSVVLEEVIGQHPAPVKNMKSGTPLPQESVLSGNNSTVIPVRRSSLLEGVPPTPAIHAILSELPGKTLGLPPEIFDAIRRSPEQGTDRILEHLRRALPHARHDELRDTAEWLVQWLRIKQSTLGLDLGSPKLKIDFP